MTPRASEAPVLGVQRVLSEALRHASISEASFDTAVGPYHYRHLDHGFLAQPHLGQYPSLQFTTVAHSAAHTCALAPGGRSRSSGIAVGTAVMRTELAFHSR